MSNVKRICVSLSVILTSVIFLLLCLSGCSSDSGFSGNALDEGKNVVFLGSIRQNSNAFFNLDTRINDSEKVGSYIMSAYKREDGKGHILNNVCLDGIPDTLDGGGDYLDGSTKLDPKNLQKENREKASKFMSYIEGVEAKNPEVDICQGLVKSNNILAKSSNEDENVVILYDSGISTKGVIDFHDELIFKADANEYWKNKNVPNLSNIDKIIWVGFNRTADNQKKIEHDEKIREIYQAFASKAGISGGIEFAISFENRPQDVDASNLKNVSVINVPEISTALSSWKDGDSLILNETFVRFEPDSAKFKDEATANDVLSEVANELKTYQSSKIKINGYIASLTQEVGNLSQLRADTVKQKLVELGCNESNISTEGKGKGPYPYYTSDNTVNPDNRFIEIIKN